jgi:hypothetical protein
MRMKINVNLPCLSALLAAAALVLSGCASQQYMGVSLKPGGADPAVQALAARASTGDKQAQLDLGIRFEEGAGVARDLTAAKKLYRQAASDSGGSRLLLMPSSSGLTTSVVSMGPKIDGNAAAQTRLQQLTSAQKIKQNHIRSGIGGMANHATESKGINMIRNLNKLANIPAGKLKVSDVSKILGVELKIIETSYIEMQDVYANKFNNEDLQVILIVLSSNELSLNIDGLNLNKKQMEKAKHLLLQNGWMHKIEIEHPVTYYYFYKDNKKIKIIYFMLDSTNISTSGLINILMSGLNVNAEGDE